MNYYNFVGFDYIQLGLLLLTLLMFFGGYHLVRALTKPNLYELDEQTKDEIWQRICKSIDEDEKQYGKRR